MANPTDGIGTLIRAGLMLLGLCWCATAPVARAGEVQHYVRPGSPAAGLTACVEPTAFMRRNHMELIQHQRDATVHQGIRGTRYSLAGCIACHVSTGADGRPVAVNEDHQFCNACHAFAAVTVNCFDCHAAVPRGGGLSSAAIAAAGVSAPGEAAAVTPDPRGGGQP